METYSNQLDILDISNINAMKSILSLLNIRQRFLEYFRFNSIFKTMKMILLYKLKYNYITTKVNYP